MKVTELLEGRGESTILFANFLDSDALTNKRHKPKFEKLGVLLLKDNWRFFPFASAGANGGMVSPHFTKQVDGDKVNILFPMSNKSALQSHEVYIMVIRPAGAHEEKRYAQYFTASEVLKMGVDAAVEAVRSRVK